MELMIGGGIKEYYKENYNKTKEDDLIKISTSIYVTNFPESFSAKDLFHTCSKSMGRNSANDNFCAGEGRRLLRSCKVKAMNQFRICRIFYIMKGFLRSVSWYRCYARKLAVIFVSKEGLFGLIWESPLNCGQRKHSVDWEELGVLIQRFEANLETRLLNPIRHQTKVLLKTIFGDCRIFLVLCRKQNSGVQKSAVPFGEDVLDDGVVNVEEGECSPSMNAKVMSNSYVIPETSSYATNSIHPGPVQNGGSILDVLERYNRVGLGLKIVNGSFLTRWDALVKRYGSSFNMLGARRFNEFIKSSGLVDINLEGYKFTWSHPSASKMSKLDRFLVTEGMLASFPSLTAECLDRHLSDHRPIFLHEVVTDFGPTPFRFYHSWFSLTGFDDMVEKAWRSFTYTDSNAMVRFKKMLQDLKSLIRSWVKERKAEQFGSRTLFVKELGAIDKISG
ncbi:RNA-directed DNA polymerase, eukaryota [Tanacetum coccineum]|uniref:RNA-directed DNA polymerase, eukaryota n=1 Tax=Tanacetum coccineum TaxID=301880 RepID=A0ABQ5EDE0_9ASTR